MPLTTKDQMNVLYDLLSEHAEECCGSVSEYQQIQRLARSLLSKKAINNDDFLQILPQIYDYGRDGEISDNDSNYVTSNQAQLNEWMNSIQNTNY
ncbi:YtzH-like family protein [Pontibacillus sp. HMF3514]|uniref:YtzH-like family protein n=1 Tax=Pontibacillus sp. HMF3514 TaxID=2692425 RepID=UPI00131F79E0|nr:YtzH-like family protein [Pontibacillus sp. HMF3514]QHE53305.1 hypothetical protein GS400_15310 [Pontibacillus sp. HMF3514]